MREKLMYKMPQLRVEESLRRTMDEMTLVLDRRDLTDFHRLLLRKVAKAYREAQHPNGRIHIEFDFTMPGR